MHLRAHAGRQGRQGRRRPETPARKLLVTLCLAAMCAAGPAAAQTPDLLRDVKRIVFLGNSITYAGDYVADIEAALLARGLEIEVLNLGLPSETATELTPAEQAEHVRRHGFPRPFVGERLERVLAATRPDLVIAGYGMNDGSSLPPGPESLRRFGAAMEHLRAVAKRHGVREVIHLTPPVYDAAANPGTADFDPALGRFSDWLVGRRAEGWRVIDLHTPMRRALDERRLREPGYAFATDGVHPGREGHWLMAREILWGLGDTAAAGADSIGVLLARRGVHGQLRDPVRERMMLLRDAWLTHTRHSRPGMRPGLPLAEARARAEELAGSIRALWAQPSRETAPR